LFQGEIITILLTKCAISCRILLKEYDEFLSEKGAEMKDERVERRNISLYPSDWIVIQQAAQAAGQRSYSGGLRAIIAEYVRMKKAQPCIGAQSQSQTTQ
jgi:hypothetical protein